MNSIIKKDNVRSVAPGSAPRSTGARRDTVGCEQAVRLLSEDGLVHAIEVTCSCGEVTLVELDYPPTTESDQ